MGVIVIPGEARVPVAHFLDIQVTTVPVRGATQVVVLPKRGSGNYEHAIAEQRQVVASHLVARTCVRDNRGAPDFRVPVQKIEEIDSLGATRVGDLLPTAPRYFCLTLLSGPFRPCTDYGR